MSEDSERNIRKLKAEEFSHHSPSCHRVNNGSFGSSPSSVLEVQRDFRAAWLAQPDAFLYDAENGFWGQIKRSIEVLAPVLNCPKPFHQHLCLVENATTAANIIAQALMWKFVDGQFKKGDAVVLFSSTYYAVQSAFRNYAERAGATLVFVDIPFPIPLVNGEDFVVDKLQKGLDDIKTPIRMVVLDHISSMPSMVFPLTRMVKVCRDKNVDYVVVDAAHAIGNVPVNLAELDVDFYFSNCHKWLFNPAAVAFFYSKVPFSREKNELTLDLHHPVAGHLFNQGILGEAAYTGTKDYSPYYCIPKGLEFASSVVSKFQLAPDTQEGLESLRSYNRSRLLHFCSMLTTSWGTKLGAPESMCCSMAMVGLPVEIQVKSKDACLALRNLLRSQYQLEVPVYTNGQVTFLRLSHQVYNTTEDYLALRDAILQIVDKLRNGADLAEMIQPHATYDWNLTAMKIFD